jgi:acetyl-CoA carboxylase biotin carboxylase subunit
LNLAYQTICIGNSNIQQSYLNEKKILDILEKYQCDAIHPGYGFFSENYLFALKCKERKVNFIGPDLTFVKNMGDKLVARQTMQNLNIPVIPGSISDNLSDSQIYKLSQDVGFPVLIKAAAGGGGKGIKKISSMYELKENINKCRFEAKQLFGNSKVYIEKFIQKAKHIEIQVLGDKHGSVIHFNERDCSIQRNNQKIIEETPAFNIDKSKLISLKNSAIDALKHIRYDNIGTLEFLLDKKNNYYFIEANTRIQVEHAITEMTTGQNLVDLQIRSSLGEHLSLSQNQIVQKGHCIECRINSEDSKNNFVPSTGLIKYVKFPTNNRDIKVHTFVHSYLPISPYYDSMIAKIVVHKRDRSSALKTMQLCLNSISVKGISTSLKIQRNIFTNNNFIFGVYNCDFLNIHLNTLLKY